MHADEDEGLTAFRAEVESFIDTHYPKALWQKAATGNRFDREDFLTWQAILHTKGWGAPHWPVEFGGTDWGPDKRRVFDTTLASRQTLGLLPFGTKMIAPVLIAYGTEEQKQKHLQPIIEGKTWWCQGYSEPGAGSDLASLKTRAEKIGDAYVVNGSKTWTSFAQWADWMFCLVRTNSSGKKQEGISFLLIDMKTPGITVRPIITLDGVHEVNEVFFENVHVPAENLIGEEDKGWTYAKYLLSHERTGTADVARSTGALNRIADHAAQGGNLAPTLELDGDMKRAFSARRIELLGLAMTEDRFFDEASVSRALNDAGPSLLKIYGSELQQSISWLSLQMQAYRGFDNDVDAAAAAPSAYPYGPSYSKLVAEEYFNLCKATIYGGSNEVQKNIIAKQVLGL